MSSILKPGDSVHSEVSGTPCIVQALLGSGGQGEVYKAVLAGVPVALKWYYPEWATGEQRGALAHLVKKGPPSPAFLWPMDLASHPATPGFGYLMPLREARFRSGSELAHRKVDPTLKTLATCGYNLAEAFLRLHALGLAYRDINFGNFFLDPATGEVMVCDLDNVGIDGKPHNQVGGVIEFMAPEIIRGQAFPSAATDRHSLAVLLFYLLFLSHPLEGKRESAETLLSPEFKARLYGYDPLYVAHPTDQSNCAVRGRHDNLIAFWPIYPPFLKKLFERSFTAGLSDPMARVVESEWRTAMVQLRDAVVYCGGCKVENVLPVKEDSTLADRGVTCWACQKPLLLPAYLQLHRGVLALNHDTVVYAHHIDPRRLHDFTTRVAEVTNHPTNPSIWGIKNLSGVRWTGTDAAGNPLTVDPGRSVSLASGTVIHFGRSSATIMFER